MVKWLISTWSWEVWNSTTSLEMHVNRSCEMIVSWRSWDLLKRSDFRILCIFYAFASIPLLDAREDRQLARRSYWRSATAEDPVWINSPSWLATKMSRDAQKIVARWRSWSAEDDLPKIACLGLKIICPRSSTDDRQLMIVDWYENLICVYFIDYALVE